MSCVTHQDNNRELARKYRGCLDLLMDDEHVHIHIMVMEN